MFPYRKVMEDEAFNTRTCSQLFTFIQVIKSIKRASVLNDYLCCKQGETTTKGAMYLLVSMSQNITTIACIYEKSGKIAN